MNWDGHESLANKQNDAEMERLLAAATNAVESMPIRWNAAISHLNGGDTHKAISRFDEIEKNSRAKRGHVRFALRRDLRRYQAVGICAWASRKTPHEYNANRASSPSAPPASTNSRGLSQSHRDSRRATPPHPARPHSRLATQHRAT